MKFSRSTATVAGLTMAMAGATSALFLTIGAGATTPTNADANPETTVTAVTPLAEPTSPDLSVDAESRATEHYQDDDDRYEHEDDDRYEREHGDDDHHEREHEHDDD